jgi:hypothetical protein
VRKPLLVGGLAALLLMGASATSASATTWSGDCNMRGTSYFDRPYTIVPSYNGFQGIAAGTCSGTLDGAPYSGPAHLTMDGRMQRPMSCETGASTSVSGLASTLPGELTFGPDDDAGSPYVDLRIDEAHVLTEMPIHYEGAYNGQGYGLLTYAGDAPTLQACAAGPGITHLDFTIEMHTPSQLYG